MTGRGALGHGVAGRGAAWHGMDFETLERRGGARQGRARQGLAWQGEARVFLTSKVFRSNEMVATKTVTVPELQRSEVKVRIVGKSPLITHAWSPEVLDGLRDKHAGKKTKNRSARDTNAEGEAASYKTEKGKYGMKAMAVKAAMITAAHKDIGIEKTLVRKALFLRCDDDAMVLEVKYARREITEDTVRVGMGSTDLRYRPYYYDWAMDMTFEVDEALLTTDTILTLLRRAGFGVGIGEWRPEKGGEYGRFDFDPKSVKVRKLR